MKQSPSCHTVLVVEDEAVSRKALTGLLKLRGYNAKAVSTAEEALNIIDAGETPEFALIDLDLPGMNGMELIERLRKDHPNVIPVLITATSRERIDNLRQLHQFQYLRKPIDVPNLLLLIQAMTPA